MWILSCSIGLLIHKGVLDMTVTLHSTAQYTESTALPNFGLAQGTRNSTEAVRRCTVTDRLAWVKTRSWLTLRCLVDLKVNLKLRMVSYLAPTVLEYVGGGRVEMYHTVCSGRVEPYHTATHSRKWRPLEILEL